MDIYIVDNEQPTTCPKCGTRTDFEEMNEKKKIIIQKHSCPNPKCKYEFIGEFE
jgi:hypothetical protein